MPVKAAIEDKLLFEYGGESSFLQPPWNYANFGQDGNYDGTIVVSNEKSSNFRLDRNLDFSHYGWIMDQFRTEYPLYRYEVRPSSTPSFPRSMYGVKYS